MPNNNILETLEDKVKSSLQLISALHSFQNVFQSKLSWDLEYDGSESELNLTIRVDDPTVRTSHSLTLPSLKHLYGVVPCPDAKVLLQQKYAVNVFFILLVMKM